MATNKVSKVELGWTNEGSDLSSVLICGRSKVGKTTVLATWPKPFIISPDKGLATIRAMKPPVPFIQINRKTSESGPDEMTGWLHVRQILLDLKYKTGPVWTALQKAKYIPQTVIIDSLSSLSDVMEEEIVQEPSHDKSKEQALTLPEYNIIQRRMYAIVDIGRELPYHFVCTAGVNSEQSDNGRYMDIPTMTGRKLGERIPHLFNEVIMLYVELDEKTKGRRFMATVIPSEKVPYLGARTFVLPKAIENPTFQKIKGGAK